MSRVAESSQSPMPRARVSAGKPQWSTVLWKASQLERMKRKRVLFDANSAIRQNDGLLNLRQAYSPVDVDSHRV